MHPSSSPNRETDLKWESLKRYIIRERQRQKQEQEADAESHRQRKEREQKQKQDVMTLGETKEQIAALETKLRILTEEKHQLFLSLKKVLNEDDNRRKQAVREAPSEMIAVGPGYPGLSGPVFLQSVQRAPMYKIATAPTATVTVPALPPVVSAVPSTSVPAAVIATVKRPTSPNTPSSHPHAYHPYNNFKATSTIQVQHKPPEDGRRNHDYNRAVLWNKGPTSTSSHAAGVYGGVYGVAPTQPLFAYAAAPGMYEQVYGTRQPAYEAKADGDKLYLRAGGPLPLAVHQTHQSTKSASGVSSFQVRPAHHAHGMYLPGGSSNTRVLYGAASTSVPATATPLRYQSSGAM